MAKKYVGFSAQSVGRTKYRRLSHHRKKRKSLEQLTREAWRQEKQILRDKAKRLGIVNHWFSDGVPPWLKRQCNKTHRRWEKRCIASGDFDKLSNVGKRKDLFDPWMWF